MVRRIFICYWSRPKPWFQAPMPACQNLSAQQYGSILQCFGPPTRVPPIIKTYEYCYLQPYWKHWWWLHNVWLIFDTTEEKGTVAQNFKLSVSRKERSSLFYGCVQGGRNGRTAPGESVTVKFQTRGVFYCRNKITDVRTQQLIATKPISQADHGSGFNCDQHKVLLTGKKYLII